MSDSDEYQKQLDRLSKLEEDVNGAEDESSIIPNGSLKLIKTEEVSQENVSPPKSDEENTSLSQSDQENTTLPPLKQDTEVKDTDSKDTVKTKRVTACFLKKVRKSEKDMRIVYCNENKNSNANA